MKLLEVEAATAERKKEICIGCESPKSQGLVVCWKCFKHRTDIIPYKDFEGGFEAWVKMAKEVLQ